MSPSLLDFLEHIYHECSFIIEVKQGVQKEELLTNELKSKAIVRSLEIIGEASKKLPLEFTASHPEISWKAMAGLRDVLIHNYFGIDYDIL
jgi:uncharacterized protein with HEPN domain